MMTISRLREAGDADFDSLVERCARDRNQAFSKLCDIYHKTYPKIGRRLPSAIVRDVIRDICGYTVDERPLPKGQSALCDFRTRKIKLNSRPGYLLKKDEEPIAWQRCVLAHELGHIRLHTDEMESGCYISGDLNCGFDDPRFFQKEFEADLYAAIFLVPLELLVKSQQVQQKRLKLYDQPSLSSLELWKFVTETAKVFGTTQALMRVALETYGWLNFKPHRKFSQNGELQLTPWTA